MQCLLFILLDKGIFKYLCHEVKECKKIKTKVMENFRFNSGFITQKITRLFILMLLVLPLSIMAENNEIAEERVTLIRGKIVDASSNEPLIFATVSVAGSNIATVCNTEGEFLLKVPNELLERNVEISHIGFEMKSIPIKNLQNTVNRIEMNMISVSLVEVSVFPSDPDLLIRAVMNRRADNYKDVAMHKTAFYRESVRRGWSYVSLTEAVVEIFKHPYNRAREDQVRLKIGRKSTDYGRMDTLAFRIQGGPFSALMLDIMKDPYTLFDEEMLQYYNFTMANLTKVDDRLLYVLDFEQKKDVNIPLFYGSLYIDTKTLAVTNAEFRMNIEDRDEAARIFIRKRPIGARVWPTETYYQVNYREHDGRWYFGHARAQLSFRVNWRRRLFNRNYHTTMEIAVTDWRETDDRPFRASDRLRMNVIMEDAVEGFSDENFWGDYNVIEPEQPIENAIRRIQRSLD